MDTMLVSIATVPGQKKLCCWIAFDRYGQHFIQNLVTVGKQETSATNLGTSSDASLIKPDIKYLFIYHLDVYQGKNKNNTDIHSDVINFPTTQKAVGNAILQS
eukprot:5326957-Ditylum_brightwellii.AAC.1